MTEGKKDNKCRREDGSWHYWKIYKIEAEGSLKPSQDETKQAGWHSIRQIRKLAKRTEEYFSGKISDKEWQSSPGVETVWYEWFKELKILY